jgi:hypothetical protein
MPTSRSIPESLWEEARRRLIFYFAHRGFANAEDLAHDTLAELVRREDYAFEKEEQFLIICHAFARRILQNAFRQKGKHAFAGLDEIQPTPQHNAFGLTEPEMNVFLDQVIEIAKAQLTEDEWRLIRERGMSDAGRGESKAGPTEGNRERVQLHRARRKLRRLINWKKLL